MLLFDAWTGFADFPVVVELGVGLLAGPGFATAG